MKDMQRLGGGHMWAVLHSEGHAETRGAHVGHGYIVKDMQRLVGHMWAVLHSEDMQRLEGHMWAVLHSEGHAETRGAHVGRIT